MLDELVSTARYRGHRGAPAVDEDAVVAASGSRLARLEIPFWPMLFGNLTIRLLGSDDFPESAKRQAAVDLTEAAASGALTPAIGEPLPLEQIAEAHDRVDAGARRRVLVAIPRDGHRPPAVTPPRGCAVADVVTDIAVDRLPEAEPRCRCAAGRPAPDRR